MLRFGSTTITEAWREPPRAQVPPYARRDAHARTFDSTGVPGEVITDMGIDVSRLVRIASGENVGFLTTTEKDGLEALYAAGEAFEFEWDRLGAAGHTTPATSTLMARFEAGVTPIFTLVNEQRSYWYMDITLRVWEAES